MGRLYPPKERDDAQATYLTIKKKAMAKISVLKTNIAMAFSPQYGSLHTIASMKGSASIRKRRVVYPINFQLVPVLVLVLEGVDASSADDDAADEVDEGLDGGGLGASSGNRFLIVSSSSLLKGASRCGSVERLSIF